MIDERYLRMYEDEPRFPFMDMVLLICIFEKKLEFVKIFYDEDFMKFNMSIKYLEERGYVKKYGPAPTDITMRKIGEDLFKKYIGTKKKKKVNDTHVWFDAWRTLFPEGSNTAGYRYRGSRLEGLKKMTKFVDSYDYTKEEIFQATKNYVERFAIRGYAFMQQAHYFIDKKDTGSALASELEGLEEQSSRSNQEPGYGRTIR